MKKLLLCLLTIISVSNIEAQPYVEGGKTRHRFAQSTFGLDYRHFSSKGTETYLPGLGQQSSQSIDAANEARLLIGGTHFWGHADFFIGITVLSLTKSVFRSSVETGMKVYPWKIEERKIRPFVGISWQSFGFKQGEGTLQQGSTFPLQTGITYLHKKHLIELTAGYIQPRKLDYFIGVDEQARVSIPRFSLSIGYKMMLDGTLSAEKNWESGHTQWLTDTLSALKRLNGFTVALGISSGIFLRDSEYNTDIAPHLGQHRFSSVFPEFGLGYYFHKSDLQINLAYRNNSSTLEAFGHKQQLKRYSTSLEAYKFLSDYHGFALFAGAVLSHEHLRVAETTTSGELSIKKNNLVRPGVVFGWDIRPNRIQTWYLRTNLRWIPGVKLDMGGEKFVSFEQLEFNFIQLVVFPGRLF